MAKGNICKSTYLLISIHTFESLNNQRLLLIIFHFRIHPTIGKKNWENTVKMPVIMVARLPQN